MQNKIQFTLTALLVVLSGCASTSDVKSNESASRAQAQSFIQTGNQLAKDGLLREAVDSYKRALAKDPDNATAQRNLGIVLFKAGDFSSSAAQLEKSMTSYSDDFDANFYLAESYRALDKYAEAIFRYKSALKIQPNELRSTKSLAWTYYKIRFYSEALSLSQKLTELSPQDEQVPVIVARVLLKLKKSDEALKLIRKSYSKASPSSQAVYTTVEGEALFEQGKYSDALTAFKSALKDQPLLAGALLGAGKTLLAQGKSIEASEQLEKAVRVKPKMLDAHYFLGLSLEKSNPQKALKHLAHFRRAAATDPEYVDYVRDAKSRSTQLQSSLNLSNAN